MSPGRVWILRWANIDTYFSNHSVLHNVEITVNMGLTELKLTRQTDIQNSLFVL